MQENSFLKYNDVEWSVPLLFQCEPVWATLVNIIRELNLGEIPKANVFGSPACNWTGGRIPIVFNKMKPNLIREIFSYIKNLGAIPTYTFTYSQLKKEDLKDEYCNTLLDIGQEFGARYIVYSDLLRDYIKEKYPSATVVASVIKSALRFQGPERLEEPTVENETNYYNKLLKEYDVVVLRPEYSRTTLLEHPTYIDDISRVEVLINQPCMANCPKIKEHFQHFERMRNDNSLLLSSDPKKPRFRCIKHDLSWRLDYENNITHSQKSVETLLNYGVKKLKVQGRGQGNPEFEVMYLLFGQMCNFDGSNFIIMDSLLTRLNEETSKFSKMLLEVNQSE